MGKRTDERIKKQMMELYSKGVSISDIAKNFKVSGPTVQYHLRNMKATQSSNGNGQTVTAKRGRPFGRPTGSFHPAVMEALKTARAGELISLAQEINRGERIKALEKELADLKGFKTIKK